MTDNISSIVSENERSRSLSGIALLESLSKEERSGLERECKWRGFRVGEYLFSRGSSGSEVFFLINGEVEILGVAASGQEFTLAHVDAGETIGEMAAIDGRPRSASVVAAQNSLVAVLSGERFRDVVRRHGDIGMALLKRLSSIVRTGDDSVIELSVHNERMETELNIARDIQMSMVPFVFPAFPNRSEFTVFADLLPAREVGGDFYDFFFIDEDRFCICIGDVSGKGVPAALFMAVAKTLIKSRAMDDYSTASILTHVNDELSSNNKENMFVTLFIAIVNIASSNVVYTSAGHNPPYISQNNGTLQCLEKCHGPVAGAMEGMVYGEDEIVLGPQDIFFLYTDGVTEAMNAQGDLFSDKRLADLLITLNGIGAEQTVKDTITAVKEFEGATEQTDDITILAFQFHG